MIGNAFIIPTGDEIKNGTVLDLDCPEIMRALVALSPDCRVTRLPPVSDRENNILEAIAQSARQGADLIVLVGGSGGGHRHSKTLCEDYTHSAMELWLDEAYARPIYGKNGHMWSKLVCGRKDNCLVVNVPGPFREAKAAIEAFAASYAANGTLREINDTMAYAVLEQYPITERA